MKYSNISKRYSSPFSSSSTFLIQISRSRLKTFPAKDLENVQFDSHPQTIILTQYSFFFTITDGNYRIIRWAREHRGKRTGKKNDLCVNEKRSRAVLHLEISFLERSWIKYFSTNQWVEYDDDDDSKFINFIYLDHERMIPEFNHPKIKL